MQQLEGLRHFSCHDSQMQARDVQALCAGLAKQRRLLSLSFSAAHNAGVTHVANLVVGHRDTLRRVEFERGAGPGPRRWWSLGEAETQMLDIAVGKVAAPVPLPSGRLR